jgi:hypothetical protein
MYNVLFLQLICSLFLNKILKRLNLLGYMPKVTSSVQTALKARSIWLLRLENPCKYQFTRVFALIPLSNPHLNIYTFCSLFAAFLKICSLFAAFFAIRVSETLFRF